MRRIVLAAVMLVLAAGAARADAENCRRSREYLLGSIGDLNLPPQAYNDLFKICLAASSMSNVKDAYILKDGGIAVVPKQGSIAATAGTLSQFCDAYPSATLRFLTTKEMLMSKSITSIVQLSSTSATPCRKIKGLT